MPDDLVYCMVEIPKGSRNKYEWDDELDAIVFDRFLFSSVVYPLDYGMLPNTLAEDGDPLDAMVATTEPTFPGCLIRIKPIALFKMADDKGIDHKIIGVPLTDPNWNGCETVEDLSDQLKNEIEHFFAVYKTLEDKEVEIDGWHSREAALKVIEESKQRWADQQGSSSADR
jgi:inorganic pyrophosphatase